MKKLRDTVKSMNKVRDPVTTTWTVCAWYQYNSQCKQPQILCRISVQFSVQTATILVQDISTILSANSHNVRAWYQ